MRKINRMSLSSKLVFFILVLVVGFLAYSSYEPAGFEYHDGLKQAFSQKYGIDQNQIKVRVGNHDGVFVQGEVELNKEGALFFAVSNEGTMEIVWDGNGEVDCKELLDNEFPQSVIGEWCS